MRCFPDEPADGVLAKLAVLAVPLLYLVTTLVFSADIAPWGRSVDPESQYTMTGLVATLIASFGTWRAFQTEVEPSLTAAGLS